MQPRERPWCSADKSGFLSTQRFRPKWPFPSLYTELRPLARREIEIAIAVDDRDGWLTERSPSGDVLCSHPRAGLPPELGIVNERAAT